MLALDVMSDDVRRHYIHNKNRNRLAAARAEKLVSVFSNLRMLRKLAQLDYEEQCWSWEDKEESQEGECVAVRL